MSEATAWGVFLTIYVALAGIRMLLATKDDIAGDTEAGDRFTRFSLRWMPGLAMLLVAWSLKWPLIPSAILTLAVMAVSFFGVWAWQRGRTLRLSRPWRIALAVTVLWVLALQLWGFVWRWDSHFTGPQFFVLHLSIPLVGLAAKVLMRWVGKTA